MILIVDNYDSFVHNLARYAREAGWLTLVVRNDEMSSDQLLALAPDAIVLSPGPKTPPEAGACLPLINALSRSTPLLGVCLGHQCLIEAFGGRTRRAAEPMHGEASEIAHDEAGLFAGIENPMVAGRYHSLIGEVERSGELIVSARSRRGELMAVRHRTAPWFGVQFHPESVLTPSGRRLFGNFLALAAGRIAA